MVKEPSFTCGIEEEYFLVDPRTLNLAAEPPRGLFKKAKVKAGSATGTISPELIRAQMEIGTGVCHSAAEAEAQLKDLRRAAIETAKAHGLDVLACSSHPFARTRDQRHTNRRRYREIAADLQFIARRITVSGMHVHVGIEDLEMRIKILNGLVEYLPLLLALSASSPFWEGQETGLKSVRPVILDELPRGGLPERFANHGEFEQALSGLTQTGAIEDASKIWWDARPSAKWPTVEIRMMDVMPLVDDALAIAALCRCLCRMLWRRDREGLPADPAPRLVVRENRWLATRYGVNASLIDHRKKQLVPVRDMVAALHKDLQQDAERFSCEGELARLHRIAEAGTSADRQLAIFRSARKERNSVEDALRKVVSAACAETKQGCMLCPSLQPSFARRRSGERPSRRRPSSLKGERGRRLRLS
jgi:carboxylate-amine ligase